MDRVASQAKDDTRRRSMLPQRSTTRKTSTRPEGQRIDECPTRTPNMNNEAKTDIILSRIKSVMPPSIGLGRSQSLRRTGLDDPRTNFGLQRTSSINPGSQVTRSSRLMAPRLKHRDMSDPKKASMPAHDVAAGQASTPKTHDLQSTSEISLDVYHAADTDEPQIRGLVDLVDCDGKTSDAQMQRIVSRHGRSSSQHLSETTVPGNSSTRSTDVSRRLTALKAPRPAFTTLQQHFSPKKTLKAPTGSFITPSQSEQAGADTVTSQTLDLQMELAQLHLLHRSSMAVHNQWEHSAQHCMKHRFQVLSEQYIGLQKIACESQTLLIKSALAEWCHHLSSIEIAEKVQLLSYNIAQIANLLDSRGKYAHVLKDFEVWSDHARRTRGLRDESVDGLEKEFEVIEDIKGSWKAEVDVLKRKMMSSSRELQSLKLRGGPGINGVGSTLNDAISGLLDELHLIKDLECDIMSEEILWIREKIQTLATDVGPEAGSTVSASSKGVWHVQT